FLKKPLDLQVLLATLTRAADRHFLLAENRYLKEKLEEPYRDENIIMASRAMREVFSTVARAADSDATVLVRGESGTGKSLIARVIHRRSDRCQGPFVELSCGALPETLLESELFGHVRGAFTGAVATKEGKFAAADEGTLFLDEISSASPALQVKLLRVVQERTFEPVGSNKTQTADVRVIVASNLDLEAEVAAGRFRQDLYYRINVVSVSLPPLRDRLGDIPMLAHAFLVRHRPDGHDDGLEFGEPAMTLLQRYSWPGNVRELENVVERAAVLATGRLITVNDLPPKLVQAVMDAPANDEYQAMPLKEALEHPERRIIEAALQGNGWNRQRTAEALQINRTTLYKKMKRYGLDFDPAAAHVEPTSVSPL
ncbi:MAG: sigma-54-dependent Fis family transcriptional regulator, partial [Planctomycetes bacterium]|nr:sigma-54-dependent Fis family transcriptional regulator [Planctomycetota bacterium]